MKLSPQQVAATKARGFVLFPASQAQIERMTMQRRIFDVDGKPNVISRDGVYFETHATLARLIAGAAEQPAAPPAPQAAAQPVTVAQPAPVAETAPEPPVEAAPEPAAVAAGPEEEAASAPRAPRRRTARPKAESAAEEGAEEAPRKPARRRAMAARVEEAAVAAPPAPEAEPQPEEAAGAAGRRRAWQTEPPRWRLAGAIRRGRPPRG